MCKGHEKRCKGLLRPWFSKTLNHVLSTIRLRIQFHWSARAKTIGTRASMSCGPCTHLRPLRLFSWHLHINKRALHPTLSTRFVARVIKTKIRDSKSIRKTVYRKNRLTITWHQQFDIICWLRSHIHSWFIIVISEIDRWTCFCNIPCHYWTILTIQFTGTLYIHKSIRYLEIRNKITNKFTATLFR